MTRFDRHGNPGGGTAHVELDGKHYSYGTCIVDKTADGRRIGNVTRYSVTTSNHQRVAGVADCAVFVTGVPLGTTNLAAFLAANPDSAVTADHPDGKRFNR